MEVASECAASFHRCVLHLLSSLFSLRLQLLVTFWFPLQSSVVMQFFIRPSSSLCLFIVPSPRSPSVFISASSSSCGAGPLQQTLYIKHTTGEEIKERYRPRPVRR